MNFRFPTKPELLFKWKKNLRRDNWVPTKSSRLCSDHFQEDMIDRSGKTVRLKPDAIPTRFKSFPKHLIKVCYMLSYE